MLAIGNKTTVINVAALKYYVWKWHPYFHVYFQCVVKTHSSLTLALSSELKVQHSDLLIFNL